MPESEHKFEFKFQERGESPIVKQVVDYFYKDPDFSDHFEEWCRERAHLIDLNNDECKLVYTELHRDFLREFEDKLTDFIDSRDSSIQEFYEQLKEVEQDSMDGIFIQILIAATDFEVFLFMMRQAAETEKRESKYE